MDSARGHSADLGPRGHRDTHVADSRGSDGRYTTSGPWKSHGIVGDVNYSLSPSAPPGLSFNAKTGELSGIPRQKVDKTYAVTIKGTNAEAKASLLVKVTAPSSTPTPCASPSSTPAVVPAQQNVTGTVGTPLTSALFAATGFPASPAITFGILPAPPAGMSLSAVNGVLSSTPTTASS
ncbi:MAG: hypothetical protein FJW97_08385, partial [Actinobacteria bacterium]|nr:hypothetical protein [Actinomycetota bacterium]